MWLVPGSVIVVWNFLRDPGLRLSNDSTATGAAFAAADWLLSLSQHSGAGARDGSLHGHGTEIGQHDEVTHDPSYGGDAFGGHDGGAGNDGGA
jgi:hypothetical protein